MAYQAGGGPLHHGYWPSHDPPSANTYSNGPHPHPQHWDQIQHPQERTPTAVRPVANGYHNVLPSPTPSRPLPQNQHVQYVNPAQLFQQPTPTYPLSQPSRIQQTNEQPRIPVSNLARIAALSPATISQVDRSQLLVSLAEEYFDAAHELAPGAALLTTIANVDAYEKLMATGLACLETALKHSKLDPRVEANIQLRYASVLFEETENFMEAETALTKGIALCERNHYYDIKYAMQCLLAQFMFKKNPKAAIKALDGHISDAQAYHHYSWIYTLRFLRASYSLESGNPTDIYAAIQNFRAIANLASEQSDRAIYLVVSLMEAMAHLKSSGRDSIEQAQRAIAAAWTYQLDAATQIPQLMGLAHILDVTCSIRQGDPNVMLTKLKDMQMMMDNILKDPSWSSTGDTIAIPINRSRNGSEVVSPDTRMFIGIGDDGRDNLMLSFLNKKDTYAITYLLCGLVLLHKNSTDQKGFKLLEAGLGSLEGDIRKSRTSSGILPDCVSKNHWRGQISCYFHAYMAFCAAAVADWAAMKSFLDNLRGAVENLEVSTTNPLAYLASYLTGVYYQGIRDLDTALRTFQDVKFDLSHFKASNLSSETQVRRDISLLAALNTLWILQHADHQDSSVNALLIAKLEEICENHPNKDIGTAFKLVVATVKTDPPAPLFKVKSYLSAALNRAKETANTQFLCITLNVMCSKFFANVVGEQAEKSAMAASAQAKRSGNVLWRSVADGMLARCYEVNGKRAEARVTMDQAQQLAKIALPGS